MDLGLTPYAEALALQLSLVQAVAGGRAADTLVLCEHPPVVTLGSATASEDMPDREVLAHAGIAVHEVTRGGRATYHGPGQLVGYAIVDLGRLDARSGAPSRVPDLHSYVARLESALCRAAGRWGIAAERVRGRRGVWVGGSKLAAIGVAVRGRVSYHGFALNVSCDLAPFGLIVPCGLPNAGVTSMALETGRPLAPEAIAPTVVTELCAEFGYCVGPAPVPAVSAETAT
jgi:lipoyl(octanoyl) transferase